MDIIEIEKSITNLIAQWLELTVDTNIFRANFPAKKNGVAVFINSERKEIDLTLRKLETQILIKYCSRDEVLILQNKITEQLPCFGIEYANLYFGSIVQRGSGMPYLANDDGKEKFYSSINLAVELREKAVDKI